MINAIQGVDMLLGGANNALGALGVGLADYRMQRSYEAAVAGYNDLVTRYNELLTLSVGTTDLLRQNLRVSRLETVQLQEKLDAEKAETARLRAFLAKFK